MAGPFDNFGSIVGTSGIVTTAAANISNGMQGVSVGSIADAVERSITRGNSSTVATAKLSGLLATGDDDYTGRTRHVQTTLLVHPAANGGYIVGCGGKLYMCDRIEDITGVLAMVLGEAALSGKG